MAQKHIIWIGFSLVFSFLSQDVALSAPLVTECSPSSYSSFNSPFISEPTYDYGPDGFVRFHFVLDGTGWQYSNYVQYRYSDSCEFKGLYTPTNSDSSHIPAGIFHLMMKAFSSNGNNPPYYFVPIDEDGGRPVDIGAGPSIDLYDPIVSVGFQQIYWFGTYGAVSAAVPIFDSSFIERKKPILIIPGMLGTELKSEGNTLLWANISRMINPFDTDNFLDDIEFFKDLKAVNGNVSPGNVINKINYGLGSFDYAAGLSDEFDNQHFIIHKNLFLFNYDWRYGVTGKISESTTTVDLLKAKIEEIRKTTGSEKINIIAHSTGGLLLKKYIYDNPNDNYIDKAVFVGVPNTGAPKALKVLYQGDNFGIYGLNDVEMKKIAQNLPVTYDLSPSQKYFSTKGSYFTVVHRNLISPSWSEGLDFNQTNQHLITTGMNAGGINNAKNLHTQNFDDFDLRTAGVDVYNIVGCKNMNTVGNVKELHQIDIFGDESISYLNPETTPGDGTVPLESATNLPVDSNHKYYALKADHAKMLSQDNIRQLIVNILTGNQLPINESAITQDVSKCQLNGKGMYIFSPIDVEVVDQDGNRSGLAEDGSIQNDIPNFGYQVWGEHKFIYFPTDENQHYQIHLKGTSQGTFTLKTQDIVNNQSKGMEVFSNLPVTTNLLGRVEFSEAGTSLHLDENGDGTEEKTIYPASLIDTDQAQDVLSPMSTSTLMGTMGEKGYYRGEVKVNVLAKDQVTNGYENQTSGLLNLSYSLDGNATTTVMATSSSLSVNLPVSSEGNHTLSFFSTDKAGNNELVQTINFVIDTTPPELIMQFNPKVQDIVFGGIDNGTSSNVSVVDQDSIITAVDRAGNIVKLTLKDKNRRKSLQADIKSLSYNGKVADINKTTLHFDWLFDKKNNLQLLTQSLKSRKDFNILSVFALGKTTVLGRDKNGKILQTFPGLKILTVTTNKGDVEWGS